MCFRECQSSRQLDRHRRRVRMESFSGLDSVRSSALRLALAGTRWAVSVDGLNPWASWNWVLGGKDGDAAPCRRRPWRAPFLNQPIDQIRARMRLEATACIMHHVGFRAGFRRTLERIFFTTVVSRKLAVLRPAPRLGRGGSSLCPLTIWRLPISISSLNPPLA